MFSFQQQQQMTIHFCVEYQHTLNKITAQIKISGANPKLVVNSLTVPYPNIDHNNTKV